MKISNFIKTNLLLSGLILVIVILVAVVALQWNKKNQPNTGTSLKTEEQISQSPVASQTAAQNQTVPASKLATEVTLFCLQLDGRQDGHLPDLMGSEAQNAYSNGLDGSNWNLPASSTGDEDYGILPSKVVFAKESFLKKWGMVSSVAIKCDATRWAPVNLQKGEINGQPAYVYQLK